MGGFVGFHPDVHCHNPTCSASRFLRHLTSVSRVLAGKQSHKTPANPSPSAPPKAMPTGPSGMGTLPQILIGVEAGPCPMCSDIIRKTVSFDVGTSVFPDTSHLTLREIYDAGRIMQIFPIDFGDDNGRV